VKVNIKRLWPLHVGGVKGRLHRRLRSGSLVVLVVLVARQSGPVHEAHHLQGGLSVGNLVTERGVIPTPSQHAITDTVRGR